MSENNTFKKSKTEVDWSLYNKDGGYNLSLEQKRLNGCSDFTFPFRVKLLHNSKVCTRARLALVAIASSIVIVVVLSSLASFIEHHSPMLAWHSM